VPDRSADEMESSRPNLPHSCRYFVVRDVPLNCEIRSGIVLWTRGKCRVRGTNVVTSCAAADRPSVHLPESDSTAGLMLWSDCAHPGRVEELAARFMSALHRVLVFVKSHFSRGLPDHRPPCRRSARAAITEPGLTNSAGPGVGERMSEPLFASPADCSRPERNEKTRVQCRSGPVVLGDRRAMNGERPRISTASLCDYCSPLTERET